MMIGDWILTIEEAISNWTSRQQKNIWVWIILILIYIINFLVFQIMNLFAQLRWPFSALVRLVRSFWPVYSGEPVPVNYAGLHKLIEEHQLVLVDFWTEWCGPCILMEGILKEFAKQQKGRIVVAKVDATINPKLTKKYKVMGYPTLMLFFKGKELTRIAGALSLKSLNEFVEKSSVLKKQ